MRTLFKIAALVLLAVIGLDMGDASCDPTRVFGGLQISSASPIDPDDPCSGNCVPDCFCCSPTLPPDHDAGAEALGLLPDAPVSPGSRLIPGTSSVPEHVPKTVL